MPGEKRGRKAAVALGYDPQKHDAPRVLAAGQGELAEALINIAQKHDIPVHTDHPLANALVKLEIGAAIPPEMYAAVAEVLAFLWRLEQEKAAGGRAGA
ncbi:MAG: FlhB domain protein [Symbiobacteriaceae bacterium]|jgi:flagellar biosynthesis protein|nr:FlhB domain protein [Symbiobacteriaceae bacterium]